MAVSIQDLLGLLIMELTDKSRSSSADFWDCYIWKKSDEITSSILTYFLQMDRYLYNAKHVQWLIAGKKKTTLL
jgi:hypothetical protein